MTPQFGVDKAGTSAGINQRANLDASNFDIGMKQLLRQR
jgi:hypothetical protein